MKLAVDHIELTPEEAEEENCKIIEMLTPFMMGTLQYSKLLKDDNRPQVEAELRARNVTFVGY